MSLARKIRRNKQVKADKPYRCCREFMLPKTGYERGNEVLYVCSVCGKTKYLVPRMEEDKQ